MATKKTVRIDLEEEVKNLITMIRIFSYGFINLISLSNKRSRLL